MLVENYSVGWRRYTLLFDVWSFMKINGVSRQRAFACLALVLLVKVEVLKPLSSSRRLDKGELPGVRSLSQYRLAGGQTASRRVASARVDMWWGRSKIVFSFVLFIFLWKVQGHTVNATATQTG